MAINSLEFIAFISVVLLIYYLIPKKARWCILLISSYFFYYVNSTKLTIFLIITTLSIYLLALVLTKLDKTTKLKCKELEKQEKKIIKKKNDIKKRWIVFAAIFINVGILIILKYCNFLSYNFNSIFHLFNINLNIPYVNIVLPLGISYYTLQAISYVVDVYRGKYEADKNIAKVALFMSFFPQMVEGPIGRYDKLKDQLYTPHEFKYKEFTYGLQLMIWGYFKKMIIADRAGIFANVIFSDYTNYGSFIVLFAMILYTIQLYAEFSGCIDIVRGVAEMFGIQLSENFKRPFFSKTVQEFWQRWHMTLGEWLKEYIFYPISFSNLTGNIANFFKKILRNNYISKLIPAIFSLLFVWLTMGIWHGASWKYVFYGIYYYLIMVIGMLIEPISKFIISKLKIDISKKWYKIMQIIRTDVFVLIGMLIFRANTLKDAWHMLTSLFSFKSMEKLFNGQIFSLGFKISDLIVVIITTILMYIVGMIQEKGYCLRDEIASKKIILRWTIYYALIFSILIFGVYGKGYNASSFIYGNF